MNKKQKAEYIVNTLDQLYPKTPIPLKHTDAYTLLIAVVLSAQCTDARVNQISPILFSKASTPKQMVELGEIEIHKIIKPCGLANSKAKGIFTFSKMILEKHQGKVPNTFEELEEMPSVGHKTASVVMSQAFGVSAFPVDTHIHRLMHRWGLSNGKNVTQTEKDAKRTFPKELWNKLHLQIIFYGREYCPARGHKIEHCPICLTLNS